MPPTGDSYTQIPSLSTAQRNLLQEALVSNKRSRQNGPVAAPSELVNTYFPPYTRPQAQSKAQALNFDSVNPAIFDVSQEHFPTSGYDTTFDESLLSTYNDTSGMFAFGSTATSPQQTEEHDKRKSPDEEDDEEEDESDHKRQEGDDKVAKKPGRKLITAEPTTKRKAQNRAAQRAFRDRKEKHLKDLEEKVGHLEKSSDATNHENAVLRAQLARMQSELSDYKKRLSSTAGLSNSPPSAAAFQSLDGKSRSSAGASDFNFDFTKFGPTATFRQLSTGSSSSNAAAPSRTNSRSMSPSQQQQTSITPSWTPSSNSASNGQAHVNSSFFNNLSNLGNIDFGTTSTQEGGTKCPSLCQSDTRSTGASPEASTPDASYSNYTDSPAPMPELGLSQSLTQTDKNLDPLAFDFTAFGDDQGFAQFNNTNNNLDFGIDWLASQNGGQFDPVLFNDYRESQDAIIGAGDFSGGFFDDNFNIPTLSNNFSFDLSPQVTNLAAQAVSTPAPAPVAEKTACQSLMDKVEACRNGDVGDNDGLALPTSDKTATPLVYNQAQMMTAHKIWTELQSCPKFKRGELDIDSLCSELSKKATCSETGLQVPKEVVEATLWRMVGDSEESAQLMERAMAAGSKQ